MKVSLSTNPLNPLDCYKTFIVNKILTPNEIIEKYDIVFNRPVVLIVNKRTRLRKYWDNKLALADDCCFIELPNDATILLWVGGGLLLGAGAYYFFGMSLPEMEAQPKVKDSYSINSNRNVLKLGLPFPEHFGRFICYPALTMNSYNEYIDHTQYFRMIGIIGVGQYEIENIFIDKTKIDSFDDIEYNVIGAGDSPTICPNLVYTSSQLTSQKLTTNWLTSFVTPPTVDIRSIEFDLVCPQGIARKRLKHSGYDYYSFWVSAQCRTIDDDGVATGDWVYICSRSFGGSSNTPRRWTIKCPLPEFNRYEFRIKRSSENSASNFIETMHIEALRGVGGAQVLNEDVTLFEIKIKATEILNKDVSSKINLICTRKLPRIYSTGAYGLYATRSIVDAFVYALKTKLEDEYIDYIYLSTLRAELEVEGRYFDHRFESGSSLNEVLKQIARQARCYMYFVVGKYTLIRDKLLSIQTQVYSDDDYNANSLELEHIIKREDDPNCVEVEYIDEESWDVRTVDYTEESVGERIPVKIKAIGCIDRDIAWKDAGFYYKNNFLNRVNATFTTGMKGNNAIVGEKIYVSTAHINWGQSGKVTFLNSTTLFTTEPIDFNGASTGKILLTSKTGGVVGPYTVSPSDDAHSVSIALSNADIKTIDANGESATKYVFGEAISDILELKVEKINPITNNEVRIIGKVYHDEVFDAIDPTPGIEYPEDTTAILEYVSILYKEKVASLFYYSTSWLSSMTEFRVELDGAIISDNLNACLLDFTTLNTSVEIKVTPYVSGVLSPVNAITETLTLPTPTTIIDVSIVDDKMVVTSSVITDADYYIYYIYLMGEEIHVATETEPTFEVDLLELYDNGVKLLDTLTITSATSIGEVVGDCNSYDYIMPVGFGNVRIRTYDNDNVFGIASVCKVKDTAGIFRYFKVYSDVPDIELLTGGSVDIFGEDVMCLENTNLSGNVKIIRFESDGVSYFIKTSETIENEVVANNGKIIDIVAYNDANVSGTPKLACLYSGESKYFKVYPTKQ